MSSTSEIVALARQRHALQRTGELEQLVNIVRNHKPATVLEIGTYRGGTLGAWCECASDDALLISVDLPGGEFGGGYPPQEKYEIEGFRREGQRIELIPGNSHTPRTRDQVVHFLGGRTVDFLFIDGDHTFEGVKADFDDYTPLLAPGAVVALHDVVPYPEVERCQVDRFWREHIVPTFPEALEIRTDGDYLGCGIGVLTWAWT